MKLITPQSNLGDTLVMKYKSYRDFRDFNDQVKMTGYFNDARVAIKDIMTFAPKLKNSKFFSQNENEIVQIDGLVYLSARRAVIPHFGAAILAFGVAALAYGARS